MISLYIANQVYSFYDLTIDDSENNFLNVHQKGSIFEVLRYGDGGGEEISN